MFLKKYTLTFLYYIIFLSGGFMSAGICPGGICPGVLRKVMYICVCIHRNTTSCDCRQNHYCRETNIL